MLKWIKSKCHRDSNDPIKSDPELCLRVLTAEVKDLRERLEMLENVVAARLGKANGLVTESKVEFKPAPKKVGRPKKK